MRSASSSQSTFADSRLRGAGTRPRDQRFQEPVAVDEHAAVVGDPVVSGCFL
jgi:hypothetical protein